MCSMVSDCMRSGVALEIVHPVFAREFCSVHQVTMRPVACLQVVPPVDVTGSSQPSEAAKCRCLGHGQCLSGGLKWFCGPNHA